MKDFDVQAEVTYKTWIRVSAEDEFSAQRKVNDMAWDMTAIPVSYTHQTLPTKMIV
mgnify:CR=1 FL=1